jgi:hypothetical protein
MKAEIQSNSVKSTMPSRAT